MVARLSLIALASAMFAAVYAGGGGGEMPEDNVLSLTAKTFKDFVGKDKGAFVEFYAPWCGHCKNLAPAWSTLYETFDAKRDGVVIAKVDADAERSLGTDYGVKGFPTIKWFPANSLTPEDYNGGRSEEDLVKFVNSKVGTNKAVKKPVEAVTALEPSTFDSAIADRSKVRLIEFYAPWCGHCKSLAPTYEKLAKAFEAEPNVLIAKVDADAHRSLGERFGVQGFPTIKYWAPGEVDPEDYNGGRDLESLVEFINAAAGTERATNGRLLPSAGRLPEFDELAKEFLSAKDKAAVLAEAQELATGLPANKQSKAQVYVKIMTKASKDGVAWIAKETKRVASLLESDSLSNAKLTDFGIRKNILAAFA